MVKYYVQKVGLGLSGTSDSTEAASPLRRVRRSPLNSAQPMGYTQPKNDPLWGFPMHLWRIWVLPKMVFLNMFKIWAKCDCSAPMPGVGGEVGPSETWRIRS